MIIAMNKTVSLKFAFAIVVLRYVWLIHSDSKRIIIKLIKYIVCFILLKQIKIKRSI